MTKKISDSKVEWYKVVQQEDINPAGNLFGGRLLQWIDEVAGIAAIRHSGLLVTTAAIDKLQFKKSAKLGDIIVIEARVTYVGNSSIEVRVDVYREDPTDGKRYPINRAFFTEVCIDEEGRPTKCPFGLELVNENERAEYEGARKRIENRMLRRLEGF